MIRTLVSGVEDGHLPVGDRGLQYGDGLFETIAVVNGVPRLWERHMQRLADGCRRLGLTCPEEGVLRAEVARIAAGEERAVAKIILTRGTSARGYRPDTARATTRIVQGLPWPAYPAEADSAGVATRWCEMRLARQSRLAGIKHLNRLEQVLARAEWRDEYAEGLMRDSAGLVIEGTMTNLFLVHEGTVITPDLSESGVAGVMRAEVLALADAQGIACAIRPVTVPEIEVAQELFLTNSLIGIWPVARLETRNYVVGKITQTLQQALSASR